MSHVSARKWAFIDASSKTSRKAAIVLINLSMMISSLQQTDWSHREVCRTRSIETLWTLLNKNWRSLTIYLLPDLINRNNSNIEKTLPFAKLALDTSPQNSGQVVSFIRWSKKRKRLHQMLLLHLRLLHHRCLSSRQGLALATIFRRYHRRLSFRQKKNSKL